MPDVPPATARWRKSTYSNDQGLCVEVTAWRTSSYSDDQGFCVEVGVTPTMIAVRDSKDPDGPVLTFPAPSWQVFLTTLR